MTGPSPRRRKGKTMSITLPRASDMPGLHASLHLLDNLIAAGGVLGRPLAIEALFLGRNPRLAVAHFFHHLSPLPS
jgi:hypothetical protein